MGLLKRPGRRWRLAALLCSQSARFVADYAFRVFVVLTLAAAGAAQRDAAWHLASALYMLPSVFLVPVYGALGNALPKRAALVGAAAYCLGVVGLFAALGSSWMVCLGLAALGSALYTPTRLALLPAAAADSRIPLSRVISASEALAALAMVGGLVLGGALDGVSWDQARLGSLQERGLPVTVAAVLLLNLCGFLTAIPAVFPSDVRRPEAPRSALAGFFKDGRRLARHPGTRSSLLAIAFLRGLVTVAAGAFIADGLARGVGPSSLIAIALACMVGAGIGSLLAGLPNDPRRGLGLVPLGATGLTLALLGAAWFSPVPLWLCAVVGAFSGLVNVPLLAIYQANTPADARGNAMAILNSAGYVVMTGMSLLMAGLAAARLVTTSGQVLLVVLLAMLAAVLAWRALGREGLEQVSGPWLRLRRHRLGERPDHRALTSKSPE